MPLIEQTKYFEVAGPRSDETDSLAEDLARHALEDAHPGVTDVSVKWVRHHQPDVWLLFATGYTLESQ